MNIYDISRKAGVSIATVSRVLNGSSSVSEKTRRKILDVMEETGYQPNAFARGLGLNTMKTVGILCADSSDAVLASAVYYIEQELRRFQYDALLCCTGYDISAKQKYMGLLRSKRVDALILVGSNFVEEEPEKNQYIREAAAEIPVIILNGYLDAANVYCSLCDDEDIMFRLASRFLQQPDGLLYISRSMTYSGRRKLSGVRRAFREAGLTMGAEQELVFNGTIEETKEMLKERYEAGERWRVILTSDDELAVGAVKFARAVGIAAPQELQIAGYNNSKPGICCEPEITSVDNHLEYSCRNAVSMLMQVLDGALIPSRVMVAGDIVERGTTQNGEDCG